MKLTEISKFYRYACKYSMFKFNLSLIKQRLFSKEKHKNDEPKLRNLKRNIIHFNVTFFDFK